MCSVIGVIDEALEEFTDQVNVKRADRGARELDAEDQPGPTGEIRSPRREDTSSSGA